MTLKIGDIVKFKSPNKGVPIMTVSAFSNTMPGAVMCMWYSESTNKFESEHFFPDALLLIEDSEK
jgi:uncharacterized protein YodC (DUF2158 family)